MTTKKVAQPTAKPLTKAEKDFIAKNRGMNATELAAALGRPVEEMRQLVETTVEKSSMVRFYAVERRGATAKVKEEPQADDQQPGSTRRITETAAFQSAQKDYSEDFTVYGPNRVRAEKSSGRSYDGSRERSLQWRRMIENGGK